VDMEQRLLKSTGIKFSVKALVIFVL